MTKWTYWKQPIEGTFRIREEIDAGRNQRIVGVILFETDAKRICDDHNRKGETARPTEEAGGRT
jgi:hypothetical protein